MIFSVMSIRRTSYTERTSNSMMGGTWCLIAFMIFSCVYGVVKCCPRSFDGKHD